MPEQLELCQTRESGGYLAPGNSVPGQQVADFAVIHPRQRVAAKDTRNNIFRFEIVKPAGRDGVPSVPQLSGQANALLMDLTKG